MDPDLTVALALADLADAVTLPRFGAADVVVETKPDLTPVTEIDRAAERAVREHLGRVRPGDVVLGEEYGEGGGEGGDGSRRWVVDPLDGTKNFVRGLPVWATLIALERDGALEVGVVSAPALHRRWWAARGAGAFVDGRPIRVSGVDRIEAAAMSYSDITTFDEAGVTEGFLALARRAWRTRALGDFWSHVLVAEGVFDVAVEPGPAYWDLAALQVIVTEAGGRFTDLEGAPRADGGAGVATNGLLHEEVLAMLRGETT